MCFSVKERNCRRVLGSAERFRKLHFHKTNLQYQHFFHRSFTIGAGTWKTGQWNFMLLNILTIHLFLGSQQRQITNSRLSCWEENLKVLFVEEWGENSHCDSLQAVNVTRLKLITGLRFLETNLPECSSSSTARQKQATEKTMASSLKAEWKKHKHLYEQWHTFVCFWRHFTCTVHER